MKFRRKGRVQGWVGNVGKGKGLSGVGWEQRGGMQERTFSYTIAITKMSCSEGSTQKSGPQITWGAHKTKDTAQEQPLCRRMAECINKRDAAGTNMGRYYKCKECAFECGTRAACIAHARRKYTNELICPCNYCGSFYAHSADTTETPCK